MKKIIKNLTVLFVCIQLTSCNEEEFLEPKNINTPDANSFVSDRGTAQASVFAIYGALQDSDICGGNATRSYEAMSHTAKAPHFNQTGDIASLNNLSFSVDGGIVLGAFSKLYLMIDRANLSIAGINNLPAGVITPSLKQTLLGEAHFLRGLAYFWLMRTYNQGSVPLITVSSNTIQETQQNDNAPRSQVLQQVMDDFNFAKANLPLLKSNRMISIASESIELNPWEEKFIGRATWGAAVSYLGKVYLYENEFDKAAAEFKSVIDSEEYSLVENFVDNTNALGEFNSESIFEVGYSDSPPVVQPNFGGGEGATVNETTTRAYQFNWGNGGWGTTHTSNFITELFKSDIVDENDPQNYMDGDTSNKSPENFTGFSKRCNSSIAFVGDNTTFYNRDLRLGQDNINEGTSNSICRKFTNWNLANEPAVAVSTINERLMRLADVYLMYAEALLRGSGDASEGSVNVTEAVFYINQVRKRAGVIDLETLFGAPRTYMQIENNRTTGVINPKEFPVRALNAENILNHLWDEERILEFAFEGRGISWQDLIRRPDLITRIEELNSYEYVHWGAKNEFETAAQNIASDPNGAIYFPIPAIEELRK